MSLRTVALVLLVACGGSSSQVEPGEPQTAKEKLARESKASGDSDGGKWGGWRYQGDRNECFYVVGRRCFKSENAACQAARCKAPKKCDFVGGGPATVSCK
jgi:hypothetical protein